MKIAVTGASGHIGYTICNELIQQGHEVIALIREKNSFLSQLPMTTVIGDVMEINPLQQLMQNCEVVIHTAGVIHLGNTFNQNMYDINVTGTQNVVEVAKISNVKRMIHFSSVHALSQKPHQFPVDEKRDFIGENALYYDKTKRDAHLIVQKATDTNFETIILCPTSVVGPFDHKQSKLGKAIVDICKGKVPAVVSGGFDFVDVRDIAKTVTNALTNGRSGETYILGNEYLTIKDFSNSILSANGSTKKLKELPLFMAYIGLPFVQFHSAITKKQALYDKAYIDILQDGNKNTSSEKAKQELNHNPRPIHQTLLETVNWLKSEGKI